jgi:hypothetical protein
MIRPDEISSEGNPTRAIRAAASRPPPGIP